jgi:hypothetical protein
MKGAIALRKPVVQAAAAVLDTSVTNITNAAYVQLVTAANMTKPASAVLVTNSGAQPIQFATGAAGVEADSGVVIPPGGGQVLIPIEILKGVRLALKSLGGTQSTGIITVTFFA